MEEPGRLQSMGSLRVPQLSDFTFTFHAMEKEIATHSSVLAWRIPWTGEPGGLPSMGSHRVGHDWSDAAAAAAAAAARSGSLYFVALFFFFFLIKKFIFWLHHTNIYLSSPTGPPGKSLFWLFKWTFYTKQLTFWHPHFLTYMLSSAMWSFRHLYRCRGVEGPLGLLDQPYLHLLYLVEKPWALLLQYI